MARSKPLSDPKEQEKRLLFARGQRRKRWEIDKPSGTSVRQLRRAVAFGYAPGIKVKNPDDYLSAHQRRALASAKGET